MKRVLIISYYWPPTGGSGVQRWVKFAKYLPGHDWQPVIYTPENPERLAVDESLGSEVPECAEVIRAHIVEPYTIYAGLFGKKAGREGGVNPLNAQKKSRKQKLAVWVRGNFFVPDPRIGWVRPSVRFLRKYLAEHPVEAIVTTGPPHSMHLIGRELKRATGVRWIADFRDPWTEMFYFKHLGLGRAAEKKHRRLEQSVLDECDEIISVTPLVAADFRSRTSTPVRMITNGYDPDDFRIRPELPADRFTVVHTGLFAADGNPLKLWDALAAKCASCPEFKEKLQIRLAGKVDAPIVEAIVSRGLGDNLANLGYIEHQKTVLEQMSAWMLMLPLRQEPEYAKVLPGKIFEYLAARRPVLGIGQEKGAAATVLSESGAGKMYDWERSAELDVFIDGCWKRFLEGDTAPLDSNISAYSRKALTEALTKIL